MTDKANIAAAAIAKLEAEKQRRLEEKIGKGHAILIPCDQALVIGGPEGAEAVVAEYKARELAKLRAAGETREVVFEEPMVIITGVPRPGRDDECIAALAGGDYKVAESRAK
jgi:hypothetical protein